MLRRYLPLLVVAALFSRGASAALAIAQNTVFATGSGTTLTKAFGSSLTSGSVIVAVVTAEDATITASASDGTNGSYSTAAANVSNTSAGAHYQTWIFTKANTATTAVTVSITFSGSPTAGFLKIYEITGQNATAVDATATALSDDGSPANLSITTTTANDTVIVGSVGYPGGHAVDSGYTAAFTETAGNAAYHWGEYELDAGAAGSKTLTLGVMGVTSREYAIAAVAIKPAGGGGSTVVNPISGKGGAAARPIVN